MRALSKNQSRSLAIGLLILFLTVGILLLFIPINMLHRHYDQSLDSLADYLGRYRHVVSTHTEVQAALDQVKEKNGRQHSPQQQEEIAARHSPHHVVGLDRQEGEKNRDQHGKIFAVGLKLQEYEQENQRQGKNGDIHQANVGVFKSPQPVFHHHGQIPDRAIIKTVLIIPRLAVDHPVAEGIEKGTITVEQNALFGEIFRVPAQIVVQRMPVQDEHRADEQEQKDQLFPGKAETEFARVFIHADHRVSRWRP